MIERSHVFPLRVGLHKNLQVILNVVSAVSELQETCTLRSISRNTVQAEVDLYIKNTPMKMHILVIYFPPFHAGGFSAAI